MKLTRLILTKSEISDLSLLSGMPLTELTLFECKRVQDLTPLKGMKLTRLKLGGCTGVQDLRPLRNMPIKWIDLSGTRVRDLSPLEDLPLEWIHLPYPTTSRDLKTLRGLEILRRMKTSPTINYWEPAKFWKEYDKAG